MVCVDIRFLAKCLGCEKGGAVGVGLMVKHQSAQNNGGLSTGMS